MMAGEAAKAEEVRAAEKSLRDAVTDDREVESRVSHAAATVGAWLKPLADRLTVEMEMIDRALAVLHLGHAETPSDQIGPVKDSRLEALKGWIDIHLRSSGKFRQDERLIIFTEYKTTLDYLRSRLRELYPESQPVQVLYGRMEDSEQEVDRDEIIAAFNDPTHPVRILVATDVASEGLNLQETARYVLHYDVPWNPARLEQRNGRLDRHG